MDEPGALNATVSRCHVSIIRRSSLFEPHEQLSRKTDVQVDKVYSLETT
jgi:hypothetical protein